VTHTSCPSEVRFAVPEAFWDRFMQDGSDRSPRCLERLPVPLAESAEVFEVVKKTSAASRQGDRRSPVRFLMEEEFVLVGPMLDRYVPREEDASLEAYADRITSSINGRRFGLALNLFHVHDWRLWMRMREFGRGYAKRMPAHYVHPAIFLGNYDRTPFGIHRDPVTAFMFVMQGRKRLHLWPPDYFKDESDPRRAHSYKQLLPDALTLEGGPGDVLFWPPGYWHVGESLGGEMSMSLNIGYHAWHPFDGLQERLEAQSQPSEESAPVEPFDLERLRQSASALTGEIDRRAQALRDAARDPAFRHSMEVGWLKHLTGSGYDPVPDALPWKKLEDEAVVRACPEYPIRWLPAPERKVVLSAHGLSFTLPANPRVLQLVERLNRGEALPVDLLITEYAGEGVVDGVRYSASPAGLRTVLSKLLSIRAIEDAR
jgi:50S ribosomal protein L16 3-hydroxylase